MGLLALRPGDSLTILLDGFVNRLQDSQFPSFLPFKLRGLDSYPGGTLAHCSCQPSLDAHFPVLIGPSMSDLAKITGQSVLTNGIVNRSMQRGRET
jgi:hypothetical protein